MSEIFIEGEKAYPIYAFSATWVDVQREDLRKWRGERDKSLPDDRCFNGTGFTKMFKEEQTPEHLQVFLKEWWEGYKAEKDKNNVWLLPKLTVEYVRHEVWCLSWFNHFTFDDGRDDDEYLQSFWRFIDRMQSLNRKAGEEKYCLMGAEDRWRWNGENNDREKPICRCEGCKKRGVVGINH